MSTSLSERVQMSMPMAVPDEKAIVEFQSGDDVESLANFEDAEDVESLGSMDDGESSEALSLSVSYQQQIRPLIDTIDNLRNLDVMKEGIQLPSIVVVGDQSSGKSSVLESLAGIKLPKGQGICTRVPLVMRLQSCADNAGAKISLEFNNNKEIIEERQITSKIESATVKIAGEAKGISNMPITLHITKVGAPDLTMVDLPGITRVPVDVQPEDIYEQILDIIMEYITPKESIILNVLAANVDFPTCESIRMSQTVDPTGERTLAVVTKTDRAPEGLLEKVTVNAVNIGLGYVCVRNAINDETNAEARKKEKQLFDFHPQLKKIEKSMVGIPTLAKKLMTIQAAGIHKTLPEIVKKIDFALGNRQAELTSLPQHLCNIRQACMAFMKVVKEMNNCLSKIIIMGEINQFPNRRDLHCTARLQEMFLKYYRDLQGTAVLGGKFLFKEIEILQEVKGVGLPNFLPRPVFLHLLQNIVEDVSPRSVGLASNIWDYLEKVICHIIDTYCHCYPQLQSRVKRVTQSLILEKKKECIQRVNESMEMEKRIDFTFSPAYMETYDKLVGSKAQFMQRLHNLVHQSNNGGYERYGRCSEFDIDKKTVVLDGIGEMEVADIVSMPTEDVEEAYNMKMSVLAYWKVVVLRLGDGIPLHLQYVCRKLVDSEFEEHILRNVDGPNFDGMERIMEETPVVAGKRKTLTSSLQLLTKAKAAVANISESG